MYNETVTILNKLKARDTLTGRDVWYKHVIHNAHMYVSSARSVTGSTVNIAMLYKVMIAYNPHYKQYAVWKQAGEQLDNYTMSVGDYIVRGEVVEDVTPETITKVLQGYSQVCSVKSVQELPILTGVDTLQLYCEGV